MCRMGRAGVPLGLGCVSWGGVLGSVLPEEPLAGPGSMPSVAAVSFQVDHLRPGDPEGPDPHLEQLPGRREAFLHRDGG